MSASITTPQLPSAIEVKLRSVRFRHAWLAAIRAMAVAASVLILLMLFAMLLDWTFPFANSVWRFVFMFVTLLAATATGLRLSLGPIRAALGLNRAASAVDDEVPQLEERWATVASLSAPDARPQTPIQKAMADQVISEAIAMERIVQPAKVAPPVALRPALLSVAACLTILAILFLIMPTQLSVLLTRFWSPTSTATATQLSSLTGDHIVPRGDKVELLTKLDGVPRSSAVLTLRSVDGIEHDYALRPDLESPSQFIHTLRVDDSLHYRVRAGDAQTSWHKLTAIDYPEVAELQFEIAFPEYTGRTPVVRDRIPRRIKVVQGSNLKLAIKPREEVKQLSLSLTQPKSPGEASESDNKPFVQNHSLSADQEGWYRFEMALMDDVLLESSLLSEHGLKNIRRLFSRIDVIVDRAPVARVLNPSDEMAVAFDETIEIEFEAHDDHGIEKAELVIYDETKRDADGNPEILKVTEIPLGDQRLQKHVLGKTTLDLNSINVEQGSEISYAVRVTDNRQVAATAPEPRTPNEMSAGIESNGVESDSIASSSEPNGGLEPNNETGEGSPNRRERSTSDGDEKANGNNKLANDAATPGKSDSDTTNPAGSNAENTLAEMLRLAAKEKVRSGASEEDQRPDREPDASIAMADTSEATPTKAAEPADATDPTETAAGMEPNGQSDPDAIARTTKENPAATSVEGKNSDIGPKPSTNSDSPTSDPDRSIAKNDDDSEESAHGKGGPNSDGGETQNDANDLAKNDNGREVMAPAGRDALAKDAAEKAPALSKGDANESSESRMANNAGANNAGAKTSNNRPRGETSDVANAPPNRPARTRVNTNGTQSNDNASSPSRNATARNDAEPRPSTSPRSPSSRQSMDQPASKFSLKRQRSRSGQNILTNRRKLKITERLAAMAKADPRGEVLEVRENVVEIDKMLAQIEQGLSQLVKRSIADADRGELFNRLDEGLGNVENYVSDLRDQTRENQYAFVGLQMVDITRTHVTPARDRVFAAAQRPNASHADAAAGLQHIVRARELLGALLKRYDRVVQENKLQRNLDQTVTMYEVYLDKRRMLMRESRQNLNPLQRKMAVIEVDQEYLDRLAEVLTLRREMMDEFAQMLGDDPRLLSRYLELIKRRGKSLRDRLTEISQSQFDATEELLGWLQIDESQKQDLWSIIIELRLQTATQLAKDAAQLSERISKQMPLEIDPNTGTAAQIVLQAKQIASLARTVNFDADKWMSISIESEDPSPLLSRASALVARFQRLSASLDQLQFENESDAVDDYVDPRVLEARAVADQADAWLILCQDFANQSYGGIVKTEQHQLAIESQLLRVEMLDMRDELDGQFQQLTDSGLPTEIADKIQQLHHLMESITFNQVAASFRAGDQQLDSAAAQQQLATERLEQAEDLFDQIRREVVIKLDEAEARNPNVADLRDPTLDEFLAQLEREPNIVRQLGIPNQRRNLRILADSLAQRQNGGSLGNSGDAAASRAKEAMKMSRTANKKNREPKKAIARGTRRTESPEGNAKDA